MKFTVQRSKWIRGANDKVATSMLLDSQGNMCCLGFLGEACGIPREQLLAVGTPELVHSSYRNRWPAGILRSAGHDSGATKMIIINNDSNSNLMSDAAREARLIAQFAALEIEINFVD